QAMKAAATRIHERLGLASSLIASVRPVSVINAKIEEIRSQCLAGLGIFGGASRVVAIRAITTMGTLIRNTEPHHQTSSKAPPTTGPAAAPTTATAPQMPIAVLRSCSSLKVRRISAKVAGIMTAAPSPKTARAPIKKAGVGENAAANDATPKTTRPVVNIRR